MARNNNPRYQQILSALEQRIRSGSILPGMKLDSETHLSTEWQCSRHTVRKALLILSHRGLLQQRPGRGWFVANKNANPNHHKRILCLGWVPTTYLQNLCIDHGYTLESQSAVHDMNAEIYTRIISDPDIIAVLAIEMRQAPQAFIKEMKAHNKHMVLIGLAEAADCDVVSLDFFNASFDIVKKAITQGHQHIAFCGRHLHHEMAPFKRRLEGYIHACTLLKIPQYIWIADQQMFSSAESSNWNAQQLRQNPQVSCCLLDSHSTAQYIEALHAVKSIPDELAIAGYGNGRLSYGSTLPIKSFDAVYEAWDDLHHIAVHRILARIGGNSSRPTHTLIPCDFVAGDSGVFSQ